MWLPFHFVYVCMCVCYETKIKQRINHVNHFAKQSSTDKRRKFWPWDCWNHLLLLLGTGKCLHERRKENVRHQNNNREQRVAESMVTPIELDKHFIRWDLSRGREMMKTLSRVGKDLNDRTRDRSLWLRTNGDYWASWETWRSMIERRVSVRRMVKEICW